MEKGGQRGLIHLPFTREARRGETIRGDIRIPEGPPPRSAVVVVHGFKGFKDWGFFPHLCDRLAASGHSVVSFNFSRNGIGSDPLQFTEFDSFGTNTFSIELEEVRLILDEVLDGELLPRAPRKVGLLGHSRGGGQAILAAAEEPRVDALVTWAAVSHFDRWSDETKREWRELGRLWAMNTRTGQQMPLDVTLLDDYEANRRRLDISGAAGRIASPWLILHGVEDVTVPQREARHLAAEAQGARMMLVNGAGHTFEARHPFDGAPPELEEALECTVRHFAQHLIDGD
jgi:pimeloyl-ACP methyl ester carboxylesterase